MSGPVLKNWFRFTRIAPRSRTEVNVAQAIARGADLREGLPEDPLVAPDLSRRGGRGIAPLSRRIRAANALRSPDVAFR